MVKIEELKKILELKTYIVAFRKSHAEKDKHPAFKLMTKVFGDDLTKQADYQITAPIEHLAWIIAMIERELTGFEITPDAIAILEKRQQQAEERRKHPRGL